MALCSCGDPYCDYEVQSRSREEGARVWCDVCGEYHYGVDAEACESPYCNECGEYKEECECEGTAAEGGFFDDGPNPVKVPTPKEWQKYATVREGGQTANLTQYVADFYLLECLANIDGFTPAKAVFKAFSERIAREFAKYLDEIIGGELRHTIRICRTSQGIPPDLFPYLRMCGQGFERSNSWKVWRVLRQREGIRALAMATETFENGKWRDGAYGGSNWATITKVLLSYSTGKLPASLFVDRCFSLEHNGGCVFDKQYKVKGSLRKCLDAHGNDDYRTLLMHASASVKALWNARRHDWHSEEWLGAERAKPITQCALNSWCVSADWHHGPCQTADDLEVMVSRHKKWEQQRQAARDERLVKEFRTIMLDRIVAKDGENWLEMQWKSGRMGCTCGWHINEKLLAEWKNDEVSRIEENDEDNVYGSDAWLRVDRLSSKLYAIYVATKSHSPVVPDFALKLQEEAVQQYEALLKKHKVSFAAIRRYILSHNYYDGLDVSLNTFKYFVRDLMCSTVGTEKYYGGISKELETLGKQILAMPEAWKKRIQKKLTAKEVETYNTSWIKTQKMLGNYVKPKAKVSAA